MDLKATERGRERVKLEEQILYPYNRQSAVAVTALATHRDGKNSVHVSTILDSCRVCMYVYICVSCTQLVEILLEME